MNRDDYRLTDLDKAKMIALWSLNAANVSVEKSDGKNFIVCQMGSPRGALYVDGKQPSSTQAELMLRLTNMCCECGQPYYEAESVTEFLDLATKYSIQTYFAKNPNAKKAVRKEGKEPQDNDIERWQAYFMDKARQGDTSLLLINHVFNGEKLERIVDKNTPVIKDETERMELLERYPLLKVMHLTAQEIEEQQYIINNSLQNGEMVVFRNLDINDEKLKYFDRKSQEYKNWEASQKGGE